jgi:hypothetical protein
MSASIYNFPRHCGPQLVPASAFNQNLRAILSKKNWQDFRQACLAKHGAVCAFCAAKPKSLDCHEIWQYEVDEVDGICVQRLMEVLPLCKKCHQVCHIGFWSLKGPIEPIISHMAKVRKIAYSAAQAEIGAAFQTHSKLSDYNFILNIEAAANYITKLGDKQ